MIAFITAMLRRKDRNGTTTTTTTARERALARLAKADPELTAKAEADAVTLCGHTLSALPDEIVVAILCQRAGCKTEAHRVLEGELTIAEGLAVLAIALTTRAR
jgi:hypothetical protein